MKLFLIQFILYSCVGAIACTIDLSVFFLLIHFTDISPIWATSISFVVALQMNFILCYKFLFSVSRKNLLNQVLHTYAIALVGLILNSVLFGLFINYTNLSLFFAKIVVVPLVMIWNFGARRLFIYSPELNPKTMAFINRKLNHLKSFFNSSPDTTAQISAIPELEEASKTRLSFDNKDDEV